MRQVIQQISKESSVWIEPPATTLILDELLQEFDEETVWYAGVPGAGGDDAIFLIGNPQVDLKQLVKQRFT